jgi:hypothetical protein
MADPDAKPPAAAGAPAEVQCNASMDMINLLDFHVVVVLASLAISRVAHNVQLPLFPKTLRGRDRLSH